MEILPLGFFVIALYAAVFGLTSVVINFCDKTPKRRLKTVCLLYLIITLAAYGLSISLHKITTGELNFFFQSFSDYMAEYFLKGVFNSVYIIGAPIIALGGILFSANNKAEGNLKIKAAGKFIIMLGVFIFWTIILLKPAAMRISAVL